MAIGIILMTLFSSLRLAQVFAGQGLALLLTHSSLAAILLFLHGKFAANDSTLFQQFIAWCSVLLPLVIRIQREEKIINDYTVNAKQVPNRLVPGLW